MPDIIAASTSDFEKTNQYILSIQVSLDGFSFLVSDPDEKRVVALKNSSVKIGNSNLVARHLQEWLHNEPLLKKDFKCKQAFVFGEAFSLVPNAYLAEDSDRKISSFFLEKSEMIRTEENKVGDFGATLLFNLQNEVATVLISFFGQIDFYHPVTKIISHHVDPVLPFTAIIVTEKSGFYLVIKRRNKIILAGSYTINHPNDLIYNVLNAFQQLAISRNQTALLSAEAIQATLHPEKLLSPYFGNIAQLKSNELAADPEMEVHPLLLYLNFI